MEKVKLLIACLACSFLLFGCSEEEKIVQQLNSEIQSLEQQKASIGEELTYIETNLSELKNENGLKQYVIRIEIKQSHFSLNIGTHIKDNMNAVEIEIPTSKIFYDNVEVGDVLSDEFRAGSFIFSGSWGSWDITVLDKYILEE